MSEILKVNTCNKNSFAINIMV